MKKRVKKRGVTLVEILITTSLIAMMGFAVYSVFASGISVWQRGQEVNMKEREARLVLERMAKEVRNTFPFEGIEFKGTDIDFTFPGIVNVSNDPDSVNWSIGSITYSYDESDRALLRVQRSYSNLYKLFFEPKPKVVVSDVTNCEITYYRYNKEEKVYEWSQEWQEAGKYPLGVRVKLTYKSGKREEENLKTIIFPVDFNSPSIITLEG